MAFIDKKSYLTTTPVNPDAPGSIPEGKRIDASYSVPIIQKHDSVGLNQRFAENELALFQYEKGLEEHFNYGKRSK
jgi:hypothetical protein